MESVHWGLVRHAKASMPLSDKVPLRKGRRRPPRKVTAADVQVGAQPAAGEAPPANVVREEASVAIGHLRRCCAGLSLLVLLRAAAFRASARPVGDTRVAHGMASASDMAALALGFQVLCFECALRKDVLGSIVTLLLAAALCDLAAMAALLAAQRAPWGEGATTAGIWEGALVASGALQAVLLRSAWGLYGVVRTLSSDGESPVDVSPLELVCEEENALLLADCDGCTPRDGESSEVRQKTRRMRSRLDGNDELEISFAEDYEDLMVGVRSTTKASGKSTTPNGAAR